MDARSSRYHEVYARWQRDPQGFWGEAAQELDWFERPKTVFDPKAGIYGRWFTDGVCNTCFNAVDRHVDAGRGEQAAIIYDSPLAGVKRTITYHRLLTETQVLGGMLRDLGVGKGDRVILYMPMVPEAVIAMLACARIGAIHSVVFGGFAARELATRIDDAKPKAILSASCGLEPGRVVAYKPLLDEAIKLAQHKPDACLILQRPQTHATLVEGRDRDWAAMRDHALVHARNAWDCVPVAATDPLYILYTSGTTGRPKGVVRDNGGHMVALKWSMKNLYGVEPGEVWWTASDIGWVVGHSYIVYAPLLHGATSILYEGKPVGTPDAGAFWRVNAEHGAFGDVGMRRQHLLHAAGRKPMAGDIDDVVGAAHDENVAVLVLEAGIGGFVVAGKFVEIAFAHARVGLPQRRQARRRQRQLDHERAHRTGRDLLVRFIDDAHVVAGHRYRRRAVFYGQHTEADWVSGDAPAGLCLPPMIDHRFLQKLFRPFQRRRIGALAGEKQRAEFRQVMLRK
jgi:hypothetical protein